LISCHTIWRYIKAINLSRNATMDISQKCNIFTEKSFLFCLARFMYDISSTWFASYTSRRSNQWCGIRNISSVNSNRAEETPYFRLLSSGVAFYTCFSRTVIIHSWNMLLTSITMFFKIAVLSNAVVPTTLLIDLL